MVTLAAYHYWAYTTFPLTYTTAVYAVMMVLTATFAILAARGSDSYEQSPPAPGRIVAIVPAYNEDPEILREVVVALLTGTIVPDVIHVVDDGSAVPVQPFAAERVIWHRQDNRGKRDAQASVLRTLAPGEYDFLLTVDSDSVIAPSALEACLRPLNDPTVQAVTSTVVCRDTRSLISRLSDLEIVSGIFMMRRARSALGAVTPTSGALSVYRIQPILENLDDYVTSGTFSDDRRMAHYCLLRGRTVHQNGATVVSDIPTDVLGTWRQRVRWYKGYWKYLGWELANLSGPALWLRMWNTTCAVLLPVLLLWLLVWLPLTGRGFFWPVMVLWLALVYSQTLPYATRRPFMGAGQRWLTWLFLTPLLIPFQLLLIRPAQYWAALTAWRATWNSGRHTYDPDPETS